MLNIIEIGCMFREVEGLSTYSIAKMLSESGKSARFVTIDIDKEHLDSCRQLIEARDPALLDFVDFRCGNSLHILPKLIAEMGEIHFAFLDGSGHPGICLKEFELVTRHLADGGLCLVDDITDTKPTEYYSAKRDFGKGTLIYPLLALADYKKYKEAMTNRTSEFNEKERPLGNDEESELFLSIANHLAVDVRRGYRIIRGNNNVHGMLVYGKNDLVSRIKSLTDKSE